MIRSSLQSVGEAFMLAGLAFGTLAGCASTHRSGAGPSQPAAVWQSPEGIEAAAIREARASQNAAIALGDFAAVARFWTEDVEIRRGLGQLVVGRDAYQRLMAPDSSELRTGSALVYQRTPSAVEVSSQWPLAYEAGTWAGHQGRADGPIAISGRYAAQWVKRGARWLIRGEVFVALACADAGCGFTAAP